MNQHVVPQPAGSCTGERRRSRSSGQSGKIAPCLLYVLVLEPLLRDEKANPALRVVSFASRVRVKFCVCR